MSAASIPPKLPPSNPDIPSYEASVRSLKACAQKAFIFGALKFQTAVKLYQKEIERVTAGSPGSDQKVKAVLLRFLCSLEKDQFLAVKTHLQEEPPFNLQAVFDAGEFVCEAKKLIPIERTNTLRALCASLRGEHRFGESNEIAKMHVNDELVAQELSSNSSALVKLKRFSEARESLRMITRPEDRDPELYNIAVRLAQQKPFDEHETEEAVEFAMIIRNPETADTAFHEIGTVLASEQRWLWAKDVIGKMVDRVRCQEDLDQISSLERQGGCSVS